MAFRLHCDADGCEVVDSTASGRWLVVHEADMDGGWHSADDPVLHFCSYGCLAAWAMSEAVDAHEDQHAPTSPPTRDDLLGDG